MFFQFFKRHASISKSVHGDGVSQISETWPVLVLLGQVFFRCCRVRVPLGGIMWNYGLV